jgi:prevent-host-death family protein
MKSFSTSDLSRRAGEIVTAATREPIMLTKHNKPALVVMNHEDFAALKRSADRRQAFTNDTIPDEIREDLVAGARAYLGQFEP